MVSKERILELQTIFKEDYGQELTYEETSEAARRLVGLLELLLKINYRQHQ